MNIIFRREITGSKEWIFKVQDKYCKLLPKSTVPRYVHTSSVRACPCQHTCQHQVILFKTSSAVLMGEKWYVYMPNQSWSPASTNAGCYYFLSFKSRKSLSLYTLFLSEDMGGVICEIVTVRCYRIITSTSDLTQIWIIILWICCTSISKVILNLPLLPYHLTLWS